MKNNLIIGILVVLVIVLLVRNGCQSNKIDQAGDQIGLAEAASDTLRNEPDGSVSKAVFAAEDVEMLRAELSRVNAQLAKQVKSGGKVGIITRTEVRIDTVVKNDTVYAEQMDTRRATIKTKDYTANIKSTPDSTRMDLTAVDSVSYTIGPDYRLVAKHSWKDLKVVEMESFYVKPKTKRTGWKFWVGVALGAGAVYGVSR